MRLKVLSYNVHKATNWTGRQCSLEKLKNLIIEVDADLVFLQEVVGFNSKKNIKSLQFEELADSIWSDFSYAKNAVYNHRHHGNLILSKYPIENWYQKDISTNRFEQRGVLYSKIVPIVDGKSIPIHLYCLHLNLLESGRRIQINSLFELIEHDAGLGESIIVAGDLNDWNKKLDISFHDKNFKNHLVKTFPSFFPVLPLDRIYTKNLNHLKSFSLDYGDLHKFSDHSPLISEIEIE